MKAKLIILSGASLVLLGGTGCTAISEDIFVGERTERTTIPFKQSHYIEVNENGRMVYRLSEKGKAAYAERELHHKAHMQARLSRRNISKPFTHLVDCSASIITLPIQGGLGRMLGKSKKTISPYFP
tara:strand:+ start:638 stop:1018 length:381 start_codon:yes stop_codon:yes gene_type:complete